MEAASARIRTVAEAERSAMLAGTDVRGTGRQAGDVSIAVPSSPGIMMSSASQRLSIAALAPSIGAGWGRGGKAGERERIPVVADENEVTGMRNEAWGRRGGGRLGAARRGGYGAGGHTLLLN